MGGAQSPSKFRTPVLVVEGYCSSDSSSPSLKQVFQLEIEVESSKTIIMPVMTIVISNLKEEMAAIKAMLEKFIKENEEKEARVKLQAEKITRLARKLGKRLAGSFTQNSKSEDEEKASVQSEHSDEEVRSKKGGQLKNIGCPRSMTVEQIQDLIPITVKAQLGTNVFNIHLYTKPYTKRVDALCIPRDYQPPKF